MMNQESQLRVQAFLDGELPDAERLAVEREIARDPGARDLAAELRNTKACLAGFEAGVKVPDSREFYWSQLQRRLQTQDLRSERESAPVFTWRSLWPRYLVTASTAAVLLLFGVFASVQMGLFRSAAPSLEMESAVADPGALTYRDFSTRTTLVWLTFPAEK